MPPRSNRPGFDRAADALASASVTGDHGLVTASELQELLVRTLVRTAGGTQRHWRIVVGPVRLHDLATHAHCNWSIDPSGTAREIAEVEGLLDRVRLDQPIVTAG